MQMHASETKIWPLALKTNVTGNDIAKASLYN